MSGEAGSPPRVLKVSANRMAYLRRLVRADIRRHQKHIDRWGVKPGQPESDAHAALAHMRDTQDWRQETLSIMEQQTGAEIRIPPGWPLKGESGEQEAQRPAPEPGAKQLQGETAAARAQLDADDGGPGQAEGPAGEREAAAGLDDEHTEGGR